MLAYELAAAAQEAGWDVVSAADAEGEGAPFLILDLSGDEEPEAPLQGAPQAICCHSGSLAALDPGGSAVGFHALPPLEETGLVELTRGTDSSTAAAAAAEQFFRSLGKHTEWVGDSPGLVLGRIVLPARQRGGVRPRRGRGQRRGHRHRDGQRPRTPARDPALGRHDRHRPRRRGPRRVAARDGAIRATAAPPRCAGWPGPGASGSRRARASSPTRTICPEGSTGPGANLLRPPASPLCGRSQGWDPATRSDRVGAAARPRTCRWKPSRTYSETPPIRRQGNDE